MTESNSNPDSRSRMADERPGSPFLQTSNGCQQQMVEATVDDVLNVCSPPEKAIIGTLAVADVHQLDVVTLLSNLKPEFSARYQNGVERLTKEISNGTDPLTAFEKVPSLLPDAALLALRLGHQEAILPEIYKAWLQRNPNSIGDQPTFVRNNLSEVVWLTGRVFLVLIVVMFIGQTVLRQLAKIFVEFGTELPTAIKILRENFVWFSVGPLILYFILMIFLLPTITSSFFAFLRRWDPHSWQRPKTSSHANRRRTLATLTHAGRSFPREIKDFAQVNSLSKTKALENDDNRNERWNLLASKRIISKPEADSLNSAVSVNSQAWLLRWFASVREQRDSSRADLSVRVVVSVMHIVLGVIILIIAVGIFSCLIAIIDGQTP